MAYFFVFLIFNIFISPYMIYIAIFPNTDIIVPPALVDSVSFNTC